MQIDIASHIEKLLFLHDALTIPSFGAFTARPTAATADYIGGTVTPPTKTLTFNENLTSDDGLLVQDVAKINGITTEEARQAIQEAVEKMQGMLNRREIVTLPGIGRLYRNYVQKIQFLPDTTNFNAESFGLPPLQFSPIARSREVADPVVNLNSAYTKTNSTTLENGQVAIPSTAVTAPPPPSVPVNSATPVMAPASSGSGMMPMLITILVLLCAMAGYWVWKQNNNIKEIAAEGPKTEQNATKPAKEPSATKPVPAPKKETPVVTKTEEIAVVETQPKPANQEKTAVKGGRECILIVATLREQINANRLIGMLEKEGHEVYFLHKNGYQVGIQFRYNQLSEVQAKMISLQQLTGEQNIWIKKK